MRLDLFDLQLFTAVAETGSITAGARRQHLALAAASTRLQRLEERLGVALLQRENRGVRLTAAGQALQSHALEVIRRVNRLQEEVSGFSVGLHGHLRILANTTALAGTLPLALGAFLAEMPRVTVELEERLSHEIVRAVKERRADLGIVAGDVPAAGLRLQPYRSDSLVAVVPAGHPLARRRRVAFEELLDSDFVALDESSAISSFLDQAARRSGRTLGVRVRLRSFEGVCRMVEASVGVAVVPGNVARNHARALNLPVLALEDAWAERRLQLCTPAGEGLSPLLQRLVERLLETAG
ncbi:MAG TPA: LysR family transcriptional regulator [Gammaproteobacteria bacterium]